MRRPAALALALVFALAGCSGDGGEVGDAGATVPVTDPGAAESYTTTLAGAAQVPGPGNPDATGSATVTLAPGRGEVCLTMTVSGVEPVGAFLHEAPAGESGPVVLALALPTGGRDGCASANERLLVRLAKAPGDFYVDVHSDEYPDGAVRGQLG